MSSAPLFTLKRGIELYFFHICTKCTKNTLISSENGALNNNYSVYAPLVNLLVLTNCSPYDPDTLSSQRWTLRSGYSVFSTVAPTIRILCLPNCGRYNPDTLSSPAAVPPALPYPRLFHDPSPPESPVSPPAASYRFPLSEASPQ